MLLSDKATSNKTNKIHRQILVAFIFINIEIKTTEYSTLVNRNHITRAMRYINLPLNTQNNDDFNWIRYLNRTHARISN